MIILHPCLCLMSMVTADNTGWTYRKTHLRSWGHRTSLRGLCSSTRSPTEWRTESLRCSTCPARGASWLSARRDWAHRTLRLTCWSRGKAPSTGTTLRWVNSFYYINLLWKKSVFFILNLSANNAVAAVGWHACPEHCRSARSPVHEPMPSVRRVHRYSVPVLHRHSGPHLRVLPADHREESDPSLLHLQHWWGRNLESSNRPHKEDHRWYHQRWVGLCVQLS